MGDGLEDGYKDETTDTQPEDDVALYFGKLTDVSDREVLRLVELALELQAEDDGRDDHRDERGEENLAEHALGGDDALDPQHDGGDVANGREGTTGVGCDDDQCSVDQTVLTVLHQLAQYHNHHDRCCQIVEDGRQEERHECHAPQQFALGARLHRVAYEVEAPVGVDNLHNRHGTHQEEQRATGIAQMVLNDLSDVMYHVTAFYHRIVPEGVNH